MRVELRIVAGSLRRRKIVCHVHPNLRPTPQMVREALFSILGNAVPDRPFIDLFAGTGISGLEALSRGASYVKFIERDLRLTQNIQHHLQTFQFAGQGQVIRTDAYRWTDIWLPPGGPVNIFVSPPFADLERRAEEFVELIQTLQQKVAAGSVVVIQSEQNRLLDALPCIDEWEHRHYGRNALLIWQKENGNDPS